MLVKKWIFPISLLVTVLVIYGIYMQENGNFHVVTKGELYRSAQLDRDELMYYIERYHIKSVLNLRGRQPDKKWYVVEIRICKKWGLIRYRISPCKIIHPKDLLRILRLLLKIRKPIFIHCKSRADRSGLVSAVWEYAVMKLPFYEASLQLSFIYFHIPCCGAQAMDRSFWRFVRWWNKYSLSIKKR